MNKRTKNKPLDKGFVFSYSDISFGLIHLFKNLTQREVLHVVEEKKGREKGAGTEEYPRDFT